MAVMRAYTRQELLALTPDRYLAEGFDPVALAGECATAAATQLLDGAVAPQELAFTAAAFAEALPLQDGPAPQQAADALAEAFDTVRRMIRQPNNERLVEWLTDCAVHVREPEELAALQVHLDAVLRQYELLASLAPDGSSPSSPS